MAIYSNRIEKHALGGFLKFPDLLLDVDTFIEEKDFYIDVHKTIYLVLKEAILGGEKVDKVLVGNKIKNLGVSFKDEIDIFDYVESLSLTQITKPAAFKSCQELSKIRVCRELHSTFSEGQEYIKNNLNSPVDEIINQCDGIYHSKLNSYTLGSEPKNLFSDLSDKVEEIGNNPQEETGISTSFTEFNRLYGGLMPGNIYAIVSRPGQGKSTWIMNTCLKAAQKNNVKTLVCDTEMNSEENQFRILACLSGVGLWYIQTGQWRKNKEMTFKVRETLDKLKQREYSHAHVANKPIEQVCSIIRKWYYSKVGRGNPAIIGIDYIKLTGERVGQNWAEHQAIGDKIDQIKKLSEELNCPIVTAMQMNRSGENFNRSATNVTDDSSAIALSDRLQWFASFVGIFRRKTHDEMHRDGEAFGTHKLIPLKSRWQGRDAAGHQDLFQRREDPDDPNSGTVWSNNFINFNVDNFNMEERGSLFDIINRENTSHTAQDGGGSHLDDLI